MIEYRNIKAECIMYTLQTTKIVETDLKSDAKVGFFQLHLHDSLHLFIHRVYFTLLYFTFLFFSY